MVGQNQNLNQMELLSRIELPNLFLTKEVLYQLSYNSILTALSYYILSLMSMIWAVNSAAPNGRVTAVLKFETAPAYRGKSLSSTVSVRILPFFLLRRLNVHLYLEKSYVFRSLILREPGPNKYFVPYHVSPCAMYITYLLSGTFLINTSLFARTINARSFFLLFLLLR